VASSQTTKLLTDLQNSGLQTSQPSLYSVIRGLILVADGLSSDVQTVLSSIASGTTGLIPADVSGFTATLNTTNVTLSWNSQGAGFSYEIRQGTVWDTASYVTTTLANVAVLDPLLIGSYHYLIKAINTLGNYSDNASALSFTIPTIGSISLSTSVIDNQVLFSWNIPTSTFLIDHYVIYRNGVSIGHAFGSFFVYIENTGGIYNYGVQAIDIAGNTTPIVTVATNVNDPANYVKQTEVIDNLNGTRTNILLFTDPTIH
jgi:hypothetical protein